MSRKVDGAVQQTKSLERQLSGLSVAVTTLNNTVASLSNTVVSLSKTVAAQSDEFASFRRTVDALRDDFTHFRQQEQLATVKKECDVQIRVVGTELTRKMEDELTPIRHQLGCLSTRVSEDHAKLETDHEVLGAVSDALWGIQDRIALAKLPHRTGTRPQASTK
jgi:predicted  nucleic acid-binding Zn-ribbon protein